MRLSPGADATGETGHTPLGLSPLFLGPSRVLCPLGLSPGGAGSLGHMGTLCRGWRTTAGSQATWKPLPANPLLPDGQTETREGKSPDESQRLETRDPCPFHDSTPTSQSGLFLEDRPLKSCCVGYPCPVPLGTALPPPRGNTLQALSGCPRGRGGPWAQHRSARGVRISPHPGDSSAPHLNTAALLPPLPRDTDGQTPRGTCWSLT